MEISVPKPIDFEHVFEPGSDERAPVILALHGTGGNEHDLLPFAKDLLPGAPILSPRGKVTENGMSRFFERKAHGVFDLADFEYRAHELAAFAHQAMVLYKLQNRRFVAVGFSNGANIAYGLLFLEPALLAGAVLLRPMYPHPMEAEQRLDGVPVLISQGMHDPMIPNDQPMRLGNDLEAVGAVVTLQREEAEHRLTSNDSDAAKAWLRQQFPSS